MQTPNSKEYLGLIKKIKWNQFQILINFENFFKKLLVKKNTTEIFHKNIEHMVQERIKYKNIELK